MKRFTVTGIIFSLLLLTVSCSDGGDGDSFLGSTCTATNHATVCTDEGECKYTDPDGQSGICVMKRSCVDESGCNFGRACNQTPTGNRYCGYTDEAFAITTETALPDGERGKTYNHTFTITGSGGAFRVVAEGALPPGLTLSEAGLLSGTPTEVAAYELTVVVYNHNSATSPLFNTPKIQKTFTLKIADPYLDPCADSNPCTDTNRTVCSDEDKDGTAECGCDEGFHLEDNNCASNNRTTDCTDFPENSTFTDDYSTGKISQIWNTQTEQYEPSSDSCAWNCNEGFHPNNQQCDPDSRSIPCINIPENGHGTGENSDGNIAQTWNSDDQQYEPTADSCEWGCDESYHINEDGDGCESNTPRIVICSNTNNIPDMAVSAPGENLTYDAQNDIFSIEQSWDVENGLWTPSSDPCNWGCPHGFVKDGSSCIESPGDLFISEYARGTGNNKYIELYNPTDGEIDLSNYQIWKIANEVSDPWDGSYELTLQLSGTLPAKTTYLIINPAAESQALKDLADITWGEMNFNGDDPLALAKNIESNWSVVDLIGKPYHTAEDPGAGWPVAGVENATSSKTLIRKDAIKMGNSDWTASAGTTPENSEWLVLDQDSFNSAGSHPYDPDAKCGDGTQTPFEKCDDNNEKDGDGCSSKCEIEAGWSCPTEGEACICAEGYHKEGESCLTDNRTIPCENTLPENATWSETNSDGNIDQAWSSENSQYEPAADSCGWSCDGGFIPNPEQTGCIIDLKPLVINEIDINSEQVELKNNTDSDITLDNYTLETTARAVTLSGAIIAGGYLVFDLKNPTTLSTTDTLTLKDDGGVTLDQHSWVDQSLPANYTLGRIPDGGGDFAVLFQSTLNGENLDNTIDCTLLTATLSTENGVETAPAALDLLIPGLTELTESSNNPQPFVSIEFGYGLADQFPANWNWVAATAAAPWDLTEITHDHYATAVTPSVTATTQLRYTYRITINSRVTYCDTDGGVFGMEQAGTLDVTIDTPIASELMITEYVEGSGTNKCIELFNGTGNAVELSGYNLTRILFKAI